MSGPELKRPNIISKTTKFRTNGNSIYQLAQIESYEDENGVTICYLPTSTQDSPQFISYIQEEGEEEEEEEEEEEVVEEIDEEVVEVGSLERLEPTLYATPPFGGTKPEYDSTIVSQAIPTPIVSLGLSSSSQYSTHHHHPHTTQNNQQLHNIIIQQLPDEISGGESDGSIYVVDESNLDFSSQDGILVYEEERTPLTIETPQGNLFLYLDERESEEEVKLGGAEIIQMESVAVFPNETIKLPSSSGQNESFILVENGGNCVLVPTHTPPNPLPKTRTTKITTTNTTKINCLNNSQITFSSSSGSSSSNLVNNSGFEHGVEEEKGMPFRFNIEEEEEEEENYQNQIESNYEDHVQSSSSSTINYSNNSQTNNITTTTLVSSIELLPQLKEEVETQKEKKLIKNSQILIKYSNRTEQGTFKCPFCSKETRLQMGLTNHINRVHKNESTSKNIKCEACSCALESEVSLKNHTCDIMTDNKKRKSEEISTSSSSGSPISNSNTTFKSYPPKKCQKIN